MNKDKSINQTTKSEQKKSKLSQAEQAFVTLLKECSRSGYFGSVSLTLNVQDGHIQHVRIATERQVR